MKNIKNIPILLLITAASIALGNNPEPRAIGFLELKSIFGHVDTNGPPEQIAPSHIEAIPLRAQPHDNSDLVGSITSPYSVVADEFTYEALAALVYELADGWARVGLVKPGTIEYGWLRVTTKETFHSLADMLPGSLCYLTENWDGILFADPSQTKAIKVTQEISTSIDVLSSKWIADKLWLEVALLNPGHCELADIQVVTKGWVPLYQDHGKRNVWFYSRGC